MAIVRLIVNDVEKSVAFYRDMFSFEVREAWGSTFASMKLNDLELWLSGPETSAAKPMPDGRKPVSGGWNRIVVTVPDISEAVRRLEGAGMVFRNSVVSGPGGSQVLIDDPSGNPVELFEPR